jgi:hypothetical protein
MEVSGVPTPVTCQKIDGKMAREEEDMKCYFFSFSFS